jgi:hypothetical protein
MEVIIINFYKYGINDPTRFYHLEQIGIGTSDVESLSGYIKRLAALHMVSVGTLICKEIIPSINASNKLESVFFGTRNILNAFSSSLSSDISNIIEQMTGFNGMSSLVPYIYKKYLCQKNACRLNLAWCPICFDEGLNSGQIYEKMIWNFKDVEICKEHGVKLIQKCPNCNSSLKVLSQRSRVGYCDKCHCWLGSKNYNNSMKTSKWDNWVYENIGGLLVNLKNLNNTNNEQLQINLRNIMNLHSISSRKLGMICDLNQAAVQEWLYGCKPTLHNLLLLSYKSGYSLLELLTKEINYPNKELIGLLATLNENYINDIDLKILLDELINCKGEISLCKFCKENKICYNNVKRKFPIETQTIIRNFEKNRKARKSQKIENIKRAMNILIDKGVYPSQVAVNHKMGYRSDVNNYNSAKKTILNEKRFKKREQKYKLPVWRMIKEAAASFGSNVISHADIKKYIFEHYGAVNENTITQIITVCSVNRTKRISYFKRSNIHNANARYDFLYSLGHGLVTLYDPAKHGNWGIINVNGKPLVKLIDDGV